MGFLLRAKYRTPLGGANKERGIPSAVALCVTNEKSTKIKPTVLSSKMIPSYKVKSHFLDFRMSGTFM